MWKDLISYTRKLKCTECIVAHYCKGNGEKYTRRRKGYLRPQPNNYFSENVLRGTLMILLKEKIKKLPLFFWMCYKTKSKSSLIHKSGSLVTPCDQTDQLHIKISWSQKLKTVVFVSNTCIFIIFLVEIYKCLKYTGSVSMYKCTV